MQLRIKKKYLYAFIIIGVLLLSNVGPIHNFIRIFLEEDHYKYSTAKGEVTFIESEWKGRDTTMLFKLMEYQKQRSADTVIYRLFSKNPLTFWRYVDYINDPRYNFPYKSWKEVKKVRGYEVKNSNNWQDF